MFGERSSFYSTQPTGTISITRLSLSEYNFSLPGGNFVAILYRKKCIMSTFPQGYLAKVTM